jgi:hypothetical protein
MTEEDEAFEELAKRQGDWGMQGSRKHQIMRYVETVEIKGTSMTGYYCVVCGKFLPADEHGVIVHDNVPHPVDMDFADEEKPQ